LENTQQNSFEITAFADSLVVAHKSLSKLNDVVLHALTIPSERINAVGIQ